MSAGLPQTAVGVAAVFDARADEQDDIHGIHHHSVDDDNDDDDDIHDHPHRARSPPPRYPYAISQSSASASFARPAPPPSFSSLYAYASAEDLADDHFKLPSAVSTDFPDTGASSATAAPAYAPVASSSSDHSFEPSPSFHDAVAETKRALPRDVKGESSGQKADDSSEPPPAYSEGYSPLLSFTYLMAAAGGAASIITQVQQGGPPINSIGGKLLRSHRWPTEMLTTVRRCRRRRNHHHGPEVGWYGNGTYLTLLAETLSCRGTRFVLSRDELLTLPEFVLLSLFPNGLFPEGHMGGFSDGDAVQVDVSTLDVDDSPLSQVIQTTPGIGCSSATSLTYASLPRSSTTRNLISNINIHFTDLTSQYDPASLQYMLEFFRNVAQSIPNETSPNASPDGGVVPIDSLGGREDGSKRAGIIVLREDLDFYTIPPRPDINHADMIEVKRAASRALLKQDGIFSGLKRSDEPGTTEAHLIEMLTAG